MEKRKVNYFQGLVQTGKAQGFKLVHTAKCQFYTEALASSSKELHQIVIILSNSHPPKILPTIYPSTKLPSVFIRHFTNKVKKLTSTLVTGTTTATFSSFEKVSQSTMKECILSSAPKSCDLDPIPIQTLNRMSRLYSPFSHCSIQLFSCIFPQCFKSALVTPILKKTYCGYNDLNNYRRVPNLFFIAKILEKLVLSQVLN